MKRGAMFTAIIIVSMTVAIEQNARAQSACAIDIKQAQLYLDLGAAEKAVSTLEKCTENEPGRSDAIAWLLLAKSHLAMLQLDKAGGAVEHAKQLDLTARLKEAPWAGKFLREFEEQYGALQVIEAPCKTVSFNIALSGSVSAETRKILESLPGWEDNRFRRASGEWFFLPEGAFRIGERDIEVVGGKPAKLPMGEIGAVCVASDLDGDDIPDDVDKCPNEAEDRDGIDDTDGCFDEDGVPMLWVVAGSVAAAALGGTVIALVATKQTYRDYDYSTR